MCKDGNILVVSNLITYGQNPAETERNDVKGGLDNWPPHCGVERNGLHFASQGGHLGVVVALLEAKVNPEVGDIDASPALHYAVTGSDDYRAFCITRELLGHGAMVDAVSVNRDTALHLASHAGHGRTVELLLAMNADPEASNNNGVTPLHEACDKGHPRIVGLLMRAGAFTVQADFLSVEALALFNNGE
jgi:ankyrin repeat protein